VFGNPRRLYSINSYYIAVDMNPLCWLKTWYCGSARDTDQEETFDPKVCPYR
jgi:hypothetical protein